MEAADRIAMRQQQSKKRRMWWCGVGMLTVVTAMVIGLTVGLTLKMRSHSQITGLKSQILLPLYASPDGAGWEPLFEQLEAHPEVSFISVINPANGPINISALDATWKSSLEKLNTYANGKLVGYVNTQYSTNSLDFVLSQTVEYATWSHADSNGTYGVQGIFYDKVPEARETEHEIAYGMSINSMVQLEAGFSQQSMVIHNTGTIPNYFDNTTDITVVFDGTYATFQHRKDELEGLDKNGRMSRAIFVNRLPSDANDLRHVVKEMSNYAGHLYLTDADETYMKFGTTWGQFVEAIGELGKV